MSSLAPGEFNPGPSLEEAVVWANEQFEEQAIRSVPRLLRSAPIFIDNTDTSWQAQAKCYKGADPELFFPKSETRNSAQVAVAKEFCKKCPVIIECLQWAIETGQVDGVLGGLGPTELKKLKIKRQNSQK